YQSRLRQKFAAELKQLVFVAARAVEKEQEGLPRPSCDGLVKVGIRRHDLPLIPQRLQRLFQVWAQMRVLRRQLEHLAQMRGILVAVEAGLVCCNFEQNAARRAEIDG